MMETWMPLGYLGPETTLPVTSVIASLAGLALMFGRNSIRLVRALAARAMSRKPDLPGARPSPAR